MRKFLMGLGGLAMLAMGPTPGQAAGLTTHVFMADIAIRDVQDDQLKTLLLANQSTVRAGAYFPDSGYVFGDPYGEFAHWQTFINYYADYIVNEAGCSIEDLDPYSHCGELVAHLLGSAAHGLGDETWDTLFEPTACFYDIASTPCDAGITGPGHTIPEPLRELAFSIPELGSVGASLHHSSSNIEYNMDIATIVEFDRWADQPLTEDLDSEDLAGNFGAIPEGLQVALANQDLGGFPVAELPPFADVAKVLANAAQEFDYLNTTSQQNMYMGVGAQQILGLAERVLAPQDQQRARDNFPWGFQQFYLNSGGVVETGRAVAGYWRALWRRLQGYDDAPRILLVHPQNGEQDLPPDRLGDVTRITAFFDHGLMPGQDGADAFTVTDEHGTPVAGRVHVRSSADGLGHGVEFVPDHPLAPGTGYRAQITPALVDFRGQGIERAYQWQFATAP